MIYPGDPWGPVGPEYPEGFEVWYGLIVIAVVCLGLWFFT